MTKWRDPKFTPTVTVHPVTGWKFYDRGGDDMKTKKWTLWFVPQRDGIQGPKPQIVLNGSRDEVLKMYDEVGENGGYTGSGLGAMVVTDDDGTPMLATC